MSTQDEVAQTGQDTGPSAPPRKRTRTKRGGKKASAAPAPEINLEHGALAVFFRKFGDRGFVYDPDMLPPLEFNRLKKELNVQRYSTEAQDLRKEFGLAMAAEFGIKFGKSVNDLKAWQRLCKRIGIQPVPLTLKDARAEFEKTNVNIVELMTRRIGDGEMEKFDTEEELAEYTRSKPGLTYPREFAPRGSLLWYLLRHIWNERRVVGAAGR